MKFSVFVAFVPLIFAFGQDPEVDTGEVNSPIPLSLRAAIDTGLAQNLGLRIQTLDPEIAEEQLTLQQSAFDPNVFSRASLAQSDLDWTQSDGTLRQSTSDSRSYVVGVSKRVVTGGEVTASVSQSRSDGSSFNPELNEFVGGGLSERASLSVEFTQPLLRDFGAKANLAPIRQAESRTRVADLQTRNAIFDLLQIIEVAYWRLADAYQRYELSLSNLELAEKLLEEADERERLGLATRIETLQAEANLAQRKEQIIRAQQSIRDSTDTLLASMGSLNDALAIEPDIEVTRLPNYELNVQPFPQVLANALERNFDSDIQEEVLEQLRQQRIIDENDGMPQVDLSVSSSYNGLSPISFKDSFDQAFDRQGDDWGISFAFNLPWGRRAAKSNLRQTLIRIDQEELRLAEIKQDLLRTVRTSWRDVNTSQQQLEAAERVVILQEATYEQETGKYDEGLSTFRTLLEAQRDLDVAKLSLLDARLSAVESEIALSRAEGTILERHGIEWNTPLPDQFE